MLSVLSDLKKSGLSVSDLSSQYWCERQMELNYKFGKKITAQIKSGTKMHEELEEKVNIPVMLEPTSWPDSLFKILYTSYLAVTNLQKKGKGREVQMYGSINGYRLSGRIDELELEGSKVIISDDKTKTGTKLPSDAQLVTNKVQMFMYRKMMDDIRSGSYSFENFKVAQNLGRMVLSPNFLMQLKMTGVDPNLSSLDNIAKAYFTELSRLPTPSDTLRVRYIDKTTGDEIKAYNFEYNVQETQAIIQYVIKYWNGERPSAPVPESEKWKCNFCKFFGGECKVWYNQGQL